MKIVLQLRVVRDDDALSKRVVLQATSTPQHLESILGR